MIQFVATVKEKNKRVGIAIAEYPEGATTCIAQGEAYLSEKLGIPRHKLNVTWLDWVVDNKNFVMPARIPHFKVGVES